MNNICNLDLLGLCFVESGSSTETIFGFSEFLAGFALLVIVYTITDFRYKFRVSVAPINLKIITFILIIFIGIGTLVSQLWVAEKWYTVSWNLSQAIWQGIFAFLFLLIITLWMWFAFILPPRFDNFNYRKFSHQIYKTVLRGNLNELDILSDELFSSLPVIIKYANEVNKESDNKEINLYANDMVLLLANRRFCKSLAVNSPSTVLRIFSELSKINIINSSCISILTSNLSSELISNKESQLYHEDEGYYSGLLGYVKPLNSSVYGDYNLVEKLSNQGRSVLDINYKMKMCWDHEQLNIYCQAVLICFESYLKQDKWYQHSFSLYRAISDIKSSIPNLHELNDRQVDFINDNVVNRFQVILDFSKKLIEIIEGMDSTPICYDIKNINNTMPDMYSVIAELYAECVHSSAYVSRSVDTCWFVQHNLVWYSLFSSFKVQSKAKKIIMYKVRRIIYEHILEFEKYPNFKAARYLGFCLNVLWISEHSRRTKDAGWPLSKVVMRWVENNYLTLYENYRDVAEACLLGGISFDVDKKAIVKTYRPSMSGKPNQAYLYLK